MLLLPFVLIACGAVEGVERKRKSERELSPSRSWQASAHQGPSNELAAIQGALDESKKEFERIIQVHQAASSGGFANVRRQLVTKVMDEGPFPWATNMGKEINGVYVQYCTMVVIEIDGVQFQLSSTLCGIVSDTVANGDHGAAYVKYTDGFLRVDPNIAIWDHPAENYRGRTSGDMEPHLPNDSEYQYWYNWIYLNNNGGEHVNGIVDGFVFWTDFRYEGIEVQHHVKPARAYKCPGAALHGKAFCVQLVDQPMTPMKNLGGSVFYTVEGGRLILRGIRTLLAGEYFTDVGLQANWIRKTAKAYVVAHSG